MFGELLESRARRVSNRGGAIVSVVAHGLFIALAVAATRTTLVAKGSPERVVDLPPLAPSRVPRPTAPAAPSRPARPVSPFEPAAPPLSISVPVVTPNGVTLLDLSQQPATAIGWLSDTTTLSSGIARHSGGPGIGEIPFAAGVDKPAIALAGNPAPRYPAVLRRANQRGEVIVQVVIDTTGRADMATLRVESSDHPRLTDAVIAALARARFRPAETGSRKVRMWAVQRFVFEVK